MDDPPADRAKPRVFNFIVRPHLSHTALLMLVTLLAMAAADGAAWADDTHSLSTVREGTNPRLTVEQAIRTANAEARRSKFQLSSFKSPTADYKPKDGYGVWEVFYSGKSDIQDDCFSVTVDDLTGRPKLFNCA